MSYRPYGNGMEVELTVEKLRVSVERKRFLVFSSK